MSAPDRVGGHRDREGRGGGPEKGQAVAGDVATALARERRRLAALLHDGVVQQVTALSLAVDSALLHHADGDPAAVGDALRSLRALADQAIRDSRALMDDLRAPPDP